jgi:hypothetical protein
MRRQRSFRCQALAKEIAAELRAKYDLKKGLVLFPQAAGWHAPNYAVGASPRQWLAGLCS